MLAIYCGLPLTATMVSRKQALLRKDLEWTCGRWALGPRELRHCRLQRSPRRDSKTTTSVADKTKELPVPPSPFLCWERQAQPMWPWEFAARASESIPAPLVCPPLLPFFGTAERRQPEPWDFCFSKVEAKCLSTA